MSHRKKNLKTVVLIVMVLVLGTIIVSTLTDLGRKYLGGLEVHTDVEEYSKYIGENAEEKYASKWGMDETIFPEEITPDMKVEDYKMVYYNPWDAQYLSYLQVEYDDAEYEKEVERLQEYKSTDYIGYYGAKGFNEKYQLLAMYADSYYGFVYALTDGENEIIYVEVIFCNYFMDINYTKYIDKDYLPKGFNARHGNLYRYKMMN